MKKCCYKTICVRLAEVKIQNHVEFDLKIFEKLIYIGLHAFTKLTNQSPFHSAGIDH